MSGYQAESIGRIIAAKRKENGLTQEGLANLLQITPQAVSKWENGVGLPDVTLIPRIAAALQISVNELFGEPDRMKKAQLPMEYQGLAFVATNGQVAVYSSKSVESKDETQVTFSDGSTADLKTQCVVNMGPGEVRILEIGHLVTEFVEEGWERDTVTMTFAEIHSLNLINSAACDMEAVYWEGSETVVEAEGSKRFLSRLSVTERDGELILEAKSPSNNNGGERGSKILVKCPFRGGEKGTFRISGCGQIKAPISFQHVVLAISGSGTINIADTQTCEIGISGSGDVAMEDARESLSVRISGCGNVACTDVRNLDVRIAGCGDVSPMQLFGDVNISISGSGDVCCSGGQVDNLKVNVNGSGDLAAEWLTVENAELNLQGSGSVTLGRIKGKSVERLSKDAKLTVKQRG
jgi:DNA-binding XRE family transcriptional regulator